MAVLIRPSYHDKPALASIAYFSLRASSISFFLMCLSNGIFIKLKVSVHEARLMGDFHKLLDGDTGLVRVASNNNRSGTAGARSCSNDNGSDPILSISDDNGSLLVLIKCLLRAFSLEDTSC